MSIAASGLGQGFFTQRFDGGGASGTINSRGLFGPLTPVAQQGVPINPVQTAPPPTNLGPGFGIGNAPAPAPPTLGANGTFGIGDFVNSLVGDIFDGFEDFGNDVDRAQRRAERAQERAQRRAERAQERAQRDAERAQERAERQAERAERRAENDD